MFLQLSSGSEMLIPGFTELAPLSELVLLKKSSFVFNRTLTIIIVRFCHVKALTEYPKFAVLWGQEQVARKQRKVCEHCILHCTRSPVALELTSTRKPDPHNRRCCTPVNKTLLCFMLIYLSHKAVDTLVNTHQYNSSNSLEHLHHKFIIGFASRALYQFNFKKPWKLNKTVH